MSTYTTIIHEVRQQLGITSDDYIICDTVQKLADNPASEHRGWCYKSRESIAEMIGITKRTVQNRITILIEAGLLIRQEPTGYLRCTQLWYNSAILSELKSGVKNLHGGKKEGENNAPLPVQDFPKEGENNAPYNNSNNNKDKDSISGETLFDTDSLKKEKEKIKAHPFIESIVYDQKKFRAALGKEYGFANLDYYYQRVLNWSTAEKIQKRTDWVATSRNFILNDVQQNKLVKDGDSKIHGGSVAPGDKNRAAVDFLTS